MAGMEIMSSVSWCDVTQAVASVIIAISSIVAIGVALKHWRDDDLHLAFLTVKKSFDAGTYRYRYVIRTFNAGRYPVTFASFSVRNGYPTAAALGVYSYPADGKRLIAPGDSITVTAIIVTEHEDVTFPESAEIWCETVTAQRVYVTRINFSDDCPAAKAKELASFAQRDIRRVGRIGPAPSNP